MSNRTGQEVSGGLFNHASLQVSGVINVFSRGYFDFYGSYGEN